MIANTTDVRASFDTFVSLVQHNSSEHDDALLQVSESGGRIEAKTGDDYSGRIFRSSTEKAINNTMRDVFLKSVLDRFGKRDVSQLPEEVKKALKLKDFRGIFGRETRMTGEEGSSITGKPLSLRRIRAVVKAVQLFEIGELTARLQKGIAEREAEREAERNNLSKAIEDGHDFVTATFPSRKEAGAGIASFDKLLNLFQTHFKKVDWKNKTCSLPEFTALFKELVDLCREGDVNIGERDVGYSARVAVINAYMKVRPDFRDFINRHMQVFNQMFESYDMYEGTEGRIMTQMCSALEDAIKMNDAISMVNELSSLSDKDFSERLKKMDASAFKALVNIPTLYPFKSVMVIKPMIARFVTGLKPQLMQSVKKAADWIEKTYPGMETGFKNHDSFLSALKKVCDPSAGFMNDSKLENQIRAISDELADRDIAAQKKEDLDSIEIDEGKKFDHGHKLMPLSLDDYGNEYQRCLPKYGEYVILHNGRTNPETLEYYAGDGVEVKMDEIGNITEVNSGKLVHELWYNIENGPDICKVIWHVDENGNPLKNPVES